MSEDFAEQVLEDIFGSGEDIPNGGEGWLVAWCECRLCGFRYVGVFPVALEDDENMECVECGHMTSEAVEYIPPDIITHGETGEVQQD